MFDSRHCLLTLMILSAALGCGGREENGKTPAKSPGSEEASSPSDPDRQDPLASGSATPESRLLGTWQVKIAVDDEKLEEGLKQFQSGEARAQRREMIEVLRKSAADLTFKDNGTYEFRQVVTIEGQEQETRKTGKWSVEEARGDVLLVKMIDDETNTEEPHEFRFEENQSDSMQEIPGNKELEAIRTALRIEYRKS